jgi:hypothetical protein
VLRHNGRSEVIDLIGGYGAWLAATQSVNA